MCVCVHEKILKKAELNKLIYVCVGEPTGSLIIFFWFTFCYFLHRNR